MRRGIRGHPERLATWKYDGVWSAACAEQTAIECEAEGDLDRARYWMDWALLRLNGCQEAPDTKRGKALLAKLHGDLASAEPEGLWAGVTPSRLPTWAVAR
jgi:hypothetical protein